MSHQMFSFLRPFYNSDSYPQIMVPEQVLVNINYLSRMCSGCLHIFALSFTQSKLRFSTQEMIVCTAIIDFMNES